MSVKIYLNSDNGLVIEEANGVIYNRTQGDLSAKSENGRIEFSYSASGASFKDYAILDVVNALGVAYGTYAAIISATSDFFVDAALAAAEQLEVEKVDKATEFPYKSGCLVALLGDSIVFNNNSNGSTFSAKMNSSLGFFSWANLFSNKKYIYSSEGNFGVFGNKTSDVLLRMSPVIAYSPNICIVLVGTNDISSGVASSTIITNLLNIWKQLTDNGIIVIAGTIFPRSDAAMTSTYSKVLQQVNTSIRRIVPTLKNVYLWDSYLSLSDTTSSVSGCMTSFFADLLHPNKIGAFYAGKDLSSVLETSFPLVQNPRNICVSGSDLFDAVHAPNGNLLASTMLVGTVGANVGAYATGAVANGWSVYRGVGSTITCVSSKGIITLPNGQTYATQILDVSSIGGGAALEEISFFTNFTTVAGDNLIAGSNIEVSSIVGRLNYVTPRLQAQYASYTPLAWDVYYGAGGADGIPLPYKGHTCTNIGTTPVGGTTTQLAFVVGLDCTVASSVRVIISLPYVRKNN